MENIQKLREEWVKLIIRNRILREEMQLAKANVLVNKITKIGKKIHEIDPNFDSLVELLEHENSGVQTTAASYLLPIRPGIAQKKLQEIADSTEKHKGAYSIRSTADLLLRMWNKGDLKFSWTTGDRH